jgi:hypothetical protein
MSIKAVREDEGLFFRESKKEVVIETGGKKLTFYAIAITFLENQNIAISAAARGQNGLALLVAASITDAEGNKFTYDEVLKLKQEIARPLLDAALEINARGAIKEDDEKK